MADSPSELQFEIETLERKHAENPEGRFFVPLANAYRKLGDVETAEALLRSGIERHPDYLSAHIVLGRCLADRGAGREAEEEFRFVLSQDPQNLIALRTLGELASADGRTGEATQWYQELLAVDPMNEEARQALETLGSAPPDGVESEFRSGAGWWEPGGDEEAEEGGPQPDSFEPPTAGDAADPTFYGDVSLEEELADQPRAEEEIAESAGSAPTERFSPTSDLSWSEGEEEEDTSPAGFEGSASSEVVTETIAELYARQGLHERAASVYRELIRRRGGDPALERRLAEIERLARDDLAEQEEELAGLALEDEEALLSPPLDAQDDEVDAAPLEIGEDAFAASFADGFTTVYDDEPSTDADEEEPVPPAAWSPDDEAGQPQVPDAAASGASIVDFLSSMARWRAASPPPAPAAVEPAPEPEPGEPAEGALEPWDVSGAEAAEAEAEDLPYLQDVSDLPPSPGTSSAEDEPFPWELPGAEEADLPDQREARQVEPNALDPYFVDDVEPAVPAEEQVLPEAAPPQPQGRREPEPPPASEASEDEDLESFQAWLRSLKR